MGEGQPHLCELPLPLLFHTMSFFTINEFGRCASVCRFFRFLAPGPSGPLEPPPPHGTSILPPRMRWGRGRFAVPVKSERGLSSADQHRPYHIGHCFPNIISFGTLWAEAHSEKNEPGATPNRDFFLYIALQWFALQCLRMHGDAWGCLKMPERAWDSIA